MRDEVRSIPSQTSPPVDVECLNTHEHQLHLVPRLIDFTCNACGTQGNRNPYFCLPCNFMIHRDCIDLPRVININRHDHLISYTPRLGHGEWKCRVFRKKVEGFYGAYSCSKCATFAVHARCATRTGVWDMVEREGTPEEEEIVMKNRYDDHPLFWSYMNVDEKYWCEACETKLDPKGGFYTCKDCGVILHISCVFRDFSYIMPGCGLFIDRGSVTGSNEEVEGP
ncbi:unnamed protein product [Brassica oleracea]